jgi:hypothetical protein
MFGGVEVRTATRSDLHEIDALSVRASTEAYSGMLPSGVTSMTGTTPFRGAPLKERLLSGDLLVGVDRSDRIEAVAVIRTTTDHAELLTALAPLHPSTIVSAAPFVTAIRARGCALPISGEAVLGNLPHEQFYESAGFVPGEVLEEEIAGQTIVRRRWWLGIE